MSDYVIPEPEPKPIDESLAMELQILASNAVLRGHPSGDERCDNCRYYLDETNDYAILRKSVADRAGRRRAVFDRITDALR